MSDQLNTIATILSSVMEKLSSIEAKIDAGATTTNNSSDLDGPTRRHINDAGDWVCDITGLNKAVSRDTGEEGFWAVSKKGKYYMVDVQGYAMFDEDRPLAKEQSV